MTTTCGVLVGFSSPAARTDEYSPTSNAPSVQSILLPSACEFGASLQKGKPAKKTQHHKTSVFLIVGWANESPSHGDCHNSNYGARP